MLTSDYVIIGSGLTGAVVARLLADAGREVLVVERRAHLGGNVHDHTHASGIRVHTYGPHYFRTSSDRIWDFATRFAPFYRYEARLVSLLPILHVAVVPVDRILTGLDELFTLQPRPADRSSSMVLITGPSRTADIEQILVRGVHGPGQVTVVLVG